MLDSESVKAPVFSLNNKQSVPSTVHSSQWKKSRGQAAVLLPCRPVPGAARSRINEDNGSEHTESRQ